MRGAFKLEFGLLRRIFVSLSAHPSLFTAESELFSHQRRMSRYNPYPQQGGPNQFPGNRPFDERGPPGRGGPGPDRGRRSASPDFNRRADDGWNSRGGGARGGRGGESNFYIILGFEFERNSIGFKKKMRLLEKSELDWENGWI